MVSKKIILALLLGLLIFPFLVLAAPSSVNRIVDHIEPLITTDFIKGQYFTATSTTQNNTFPRVVVTNGTTTNATSTSQHISGNFSFNGIVGSTWASFCTAITGGAGLCDGVDATGGGGASDWAVDSSGQLTPTTTRVIAVNGVIATGTATSTYTGGIQTLGLNATGFVTLMGETFTNLTTYVRSLFSETITGIDYSAGVFSLTSGFNIPLTASTTNWNTFYDTPSNRITAGTNLSWAGNTLNATAGSGGAISTSTVPVPGNLAWWSSPSALGTVGTSSLTASSPLSLSNPVAFIGSVASAISCAVATGSVTGCLSSTDWTAFNNKVSSTSQSATYPLSYNSGTGVFSWLGLGTTTTWTPGNLAWVVNGNTVASVGTSTVTASSPLTGSFTAVGSGGTVGIQAGSASQNGYIASGDWSTFNNKVSSTSLSATSPIFYSSATGVISSQAATAAQNGFLTLGDWATFYNKVSSTSIDTSAELAALLTDETGSGALVFGTNATLASTTLTGLTTMQSATTTTFGILGLSAANCDVKANTNGGIYCGTDATGAGALADWNKQTNFGADALTPTTTIPVWVKGSLYASSSVIIDGNVGIGSSTPSHRLSVSGNSYLGGNLTATGTATLGTSTITGGLNIYNSALTKGIELYFPGTSAYQYMYSGSNFSDYLVSSAPGSSSFSMSEGSNSFALQPGARSYFLNTFNFGFGTTSPSAKVSIHARAGETEPELFTIASSTLTATTSLFTISNTGSTTIASLTAANCDLKATTLGGIYCGTDATTAAGGGDGVSNWSNFSGFLSPSTTVGITVNASSSIASLSMTNATATNATSTNFYTSLFGLNSEYFTDLTGSGLLNTANALTLATANASTFGGLLAADWTTFNNKVSSTSLSATYPLTYNSSTGAFTFSGLATSSTAWTPGNLAWAVNGNTVSTIATGTVSAGAGLSVTAGRSVIGGAMAYTCATSDASTFGCLATADWQSFTNKISSTSIDTSSELAALLTDELGSGPLTFASSSVMSSTTLYGDTLLLGSTTLQSATSTSFFATVASSTSAFASNLTATIGTFVNQLTAPYFAALSLVTNGDIGIDSTSNQFRYRSNGADKVLGDGNFYPAFTYATSTAWTGTTTIPLGPAYTAETWNGVKCFTDVGTLNVSFYDGTNRMDLLNASTTVNVINLITNNTFISSEKRYVDIGTPASSPTKVSCTVSKSLTSD